MEKVANRPLSSVKRKPGLVRVPRTAPRNGPERRGYACQTKKRPGFRMPCLRPHVPPVHLPAIVPGSPGMHAVTAAQMPQMREPGLGRSDLLNLTDAGRAASPCRSFVF